MGSGCQLGIPLGKERATRFGIARIKPFRQHPFRHLFAEQEAIEFFRYDSWFDCTKEFRYFIKGVVPYPPIV